MFSLFKIRFHNRKDFDAALKVLNINNLTPFVDIGYSDLILTYDDYQERFNAGEKLIEYRIPYFID